MSHAVPRGTWRCAGVGAGATMVTLAPDWPVTANNAYVNIHNPA